ncbi:MAG: PqqD family protein [Myxococcota bacterium]
MLTPRVLDTVMLQEEGGESFALDLESGEVFSLNPTAAQILRMCQLGRSLPDITAQLLSETLEPADPELVKEDVEETVQTFISLGLCTY